MYNQPMYWTRRHGSVNSAVTLTRSMSLGYWPLGSCVPVYDSTVKEIATTTSIVRQSTSIFLPSCEYSASCESQRPWSASRSSSASPAWLPEGFCLLCALTLSLICVAIIHKL